VDPESFRLIGIGELRQEQRVGGLPGSFISFFVDLFVISFHFDAAAVRRANCWFGTCKWTDQRRILGHSPDIWIGSGPWPFHPTADSSLPAMGMGK
jgi:hypothetical protein